MFNTGSGGRMTVAELLDKLKDYDGDTEIVIVRVGIRGKKYPDRIDNVMDGAYLCGYDKEFAGKVALW
jgi:hypothetical protein